MILWVRIWADLILALLMLQQGLAVITYSNIFFLEISLTRSSCSLATFSVIFIYCVTAGICPFSNLQDQFPHCIPNSTSNLLTSPQASTLLPTKSLASILVFCYGDNLFPVFIFEFRFLFFIFCSFHFLFWLPNSG